MSVCKRGEERLITIQFRQQKDAALFYKKLKYYTSSLSAIQVRVTLKPEPLVKISFKEDKEEYVRLYILPVMVEYLLVAVEGKWIKEMIQSMFYYTDEEEQRQIMSIARSIMDGEKTDIPFVPILNQCDPREQLIEQALSNFLTTSISFSFESFLQFRLKDYRFRLVQYVEAAIDEYKLEQEYQNFIENLRSYLYNREALINKVFLVYDKSFLFLDENFNKISEEVLKTTIDEEILSIEDLDIESMVIAPLISIAPTSLVILTDNIDHGMIQTIQNIFLERVSLISLKEFNKEQAKRQKMIRKS